MLEQARADTADRLLLVRSNDQNGHGPHLMYTSIHNTILLKNSSAILSTSEYMYNFKYPLFKHDLSNKSA